MTLGLGSSLVDQNQPRSAEGSWSVIEAGKGSKSNCCAREKDPAQDSISLRAAAQFYVGDPGKSFSAITLPRITIVIITARDANYIRFIGCDVQPSVVVQRSSMLWVKWF